MRVGISFCYANTAVVPTGLKEDKRERRLIGFEFSAEVVACAGVSQ